MLRLASLLVVLMGSALAVSAVKVPTTYCDAAKDAVNIPGSLEADVWPPALGATLKLSLNADVDAVIMHSSFRVNDSFTPENGVTTMSLEIPSGAHTGVYQFNIHGKKGDAEVYCVESRFSLTSTPEDRGTDKMWDEVSNRLKVMNKNRAQILREAREGAPDFVPDSSRPVEQFDPLAVHEHMLKTHDAVHARYPHMMGDQRSKAMKEQDALEAAQAALEDANVQ